jgi:hypothetical protein
MEIRDRRVRGKIHGMEVEAIPDSGADESFISASFLRKLQQRRHRTLAGMGILETELNEQSSVQLASGKYVACPSMVSVPWEFEGEDKIHWLRCRVLQQATQDLILGDSFLRATETFTRFKHRITTKLRSLGTKLLRLNYLGSDERRLWGHLNGDFVGALPDSGSDIMAISSDYARRQGLRINRKRDKQVEVQFADGSTAWTVGVVCGLEWEFGSSTEFPVMADFYVLDNLPVDVLFNSDFVFDFNVFDQHDVSLYHCDSALKLSQLCNIRLIGRYSNHLFKLEDEYIVDGELPTNHGRVAT